VLRILPRLYFLGAPWGGVLPLLGLSALGFLTFFLPLLPMTTSCIFSFYFRYLFLTLSSSLMKVASRIVKSIIKAAPKARKRYGSEKLVNMPQQPRAQSPMPRIKEAITPKYCVFPPFFSPQLTIFKSSQIKTAIGTIDSNARPLSPKSATNFKIPLSSPLKRGDDVLVIGY
jgi:hypothetical protein